MGINEQLDLGLFGPQSVVWKFHSSKVALVGGIRALMIQALEPRAMAAVEKAGGYKVDPAGRLARTIEFIQTVSFAPTKEAMAAISKVNSIHSRINGPLDLHLSIAINPRLHLRLMLHTLQSKP